MMNFTILRSDKQLSRIAVLYLGLFAANPRHGYIFPSSFALFEEVLINVL